MVFELLLGDVESLLKDIDGKLSNIEKLHEFHLTPRDLKEYKEWKLSKRKPN